jgi:hypothetical protein
LVSGPCGADLTGDGRPELICGVRLGAIASVAESGRKTRSWNAPPVILPGGRPRNDRRTFEAGGNGVTTGDFDNDGRLDLVRIQLGRNSPYQEAIQGGWRIYFGDLSGRGGVERSKPALTSIISGWFLGAIWSRSPRRCRGFRRKYPTAASYL